MAEYKDATMDTGLQRTTAEDSAAAGRMLDRLAERAKTPVTVDEVQTMRAMLGLKEKA